MKNVHNTPSQHGITKLTKSKKAICIIMIGCSVLVEKLCDNGNETLPINQQIQPLVQGNKNTIEIGNITTLKVPLQQEIKKEINNGKSVNMDKYQDIIHNFSFYYLGGLLGMIDNFPDTYIEKVKKILIKKGVDLSEIPEITQETLYEWARFGLLNKPSYGIISLTNKIKEGNGTINDIKKRESVIRQFLELSGYESDIPLLLPYEIKQSLQSTRLQSIYSLQKDIENGGSDSLDLITRDKFIEAFLKDGGSHAAIVDVSDERELESRTKLQEYLMKDIIKYTIRIKETDLNKIKIRDIFLDVQDRQSFIDQYLQYDGNPSHIPHINEQEINRFNERQKNILLRKIAQLTTEIMSYETKLINGHDIMEIKKTGSFIRTQRMQYKTNVAEKEFLMMNLTQLTTGINQFGDLEEY